MPPAEFDRPPLTETLMGIQFRPLPKLRLAHLGAFWATLGPEWSDVAEVPALGQTMEPAGVEASWLERGASMEMFEGAGVRLRALNAKRSRMIQIENGWFVYNWRKAKSDDAYARYDTIRLEFDELLTQFEAFLTQHSLGSVEANLWEIGYVNFVARGTLWERVQDWPRIIPHLLARDLCDSDDQLQTLDGRWVWALDGGRARLQVTIEHGRSSASSKEELLVVKLIARGQTSGASLELAGQGLDLGHEAIVRKFTAITSDEARMHWGYKS